MNSLDLREQRLRQKKTSLVCDYMMHRYKDDNDIIKISGERRYTLDSLTATPNIPITISGNFFEPNSTYKFDIGLRTIHNSENFIVLNGFNAEISP